MAVPDHVAELIERFRENESVYRSSKYNEAQIRQEFIDPMFVALGWDLRNEQNASETYKDVIVEDSIKSDGSITAPDYCFRIGGNRKFFVESKRPSVNLAESASAAYQVRRYGWSAKLSVSVLTDFEEFAIYDCRVEPKKNDKSSVARSLYLKYTEYCDRWDEIYSLFSKEAVLAGSLDQFAEATKTRRGAATVDAVFLKEIESWREWLAIAISSQNPELKQRELNFAVQMTINRLIFLRICEDRGIEPYAQLSALTKNGQVYEELCRLFRQADARYNSGLFHFQPEKGRLDADEFTLKLMIADQPLEQIIQGLYYPDSPYEFSVMPIEILGQVYEQFLGKVIRLTADHKAVVEDKPEVRKAGGVYYTPTYIVDYIVENTVGRLLKGKTPKQAEKIRVLDPACGSGSFLIGAYRFLLDWYLEQYGANPTKNKKKLYVGAGGGWRLTSEEKKRILLNHIYGVDIDLQAVETTKLSLLLKVLEGESQETVSQQLKLLQERALPDLENNIKCGNSLIGSDYYNSVQMGLLNEEEVYRINVFDWEEGFPEIMKAGGFDAVIGNPPYGAEFSQPTKDYLKDKYITFVWRGESYLVFVEQAIKLLRVKGQFSYIIPDTYLNLDFTRALRIFLFENTKIKEVVSLPSNVFKRIGAKQNPIVDTTLLFTEKAPCVLPSSPLHVSDVLVRIFNKKASINSVSKSNSEYLTSTLTWYEQGAFNIQSNTAETEIIQKAERQNHPLSNVAEMFYGIKVYQIGKGKPPQTEEIRDTKPFTSTRREDGQFLPFFDGKHIGRYQLLWKDNNWLNYGSWLAEPRQPVKFEGEKILIRKIVGETLIATYISDTSYCNTLLYVVKLKLEVNLNYHYILGTLNSRFVGWYFRKKFQISADDTFPQIMIRDILQFPIPSPQIDKHDRIVALVEQMLSLHKRLADAKMPSDKKTIEQQIKVTDRQIDQLVYELYELTDEEIAIVEGK